MKGEFDDKTLEMILAETKPNEFINDLSDFVINPNIGGVTPLDLETAPPMVTGMIFLRAFSLTTFSSGIALWFDQSYDDYPDLVRFFDKIGAQPAAAYIRAATALFPKGRVPKNSDARSDYGDEHDAEFRQIDRQWPVG